MTDHHHHHDHSGPIAIGATAARVVIGLLTGFGVLVVIGAVLLWPSHQHIDIPLPMQNGGGGAVHTESGTVTMQDTGPCGSPSNGKTFDDTPQPPPNNTYSCARSLVSIESGPAKGKHTLLEIAPGAGQPSLRTGDHIRMEVQNDPSGQPAYSFEDYSRGFPLTLLLVIFVVVVTVVARWRGLRAVLGLVFAFAVLVEFMLPALLEGKPALPVAVVAGALILYAVLYLAHGVNLRTSSALLGTLSAMLLATVLSWTALKITHVTGLSQEDNTNVQTYVQHVSITGLLLAGFIIGSLGVLNDVTITQASAAFELAAIDENATRRDVFSSAMRVGRDHIASTVYTLVLAYAGGALPLLLLFSVAGRPLTDVITSDAVAIEIARSAVGGICLALSVPLTTAIAVLLARPFSLRAEPEPAPVRRRARPAETGAAQRPSRRAPGTAAQRRIADKRRQARDDSGDQDDDADDGYMNNLSQKENRPRRPGRGGPPDREGRGSPDREGRGGTSDREARQTGARRRPADPPVTRTAAEPPRRNRLLDQIPPGHRFAESPEAADAPRPPNRRQDTGPTVTGGFGSRGQDTAGRDTGGNPGADWFSQTPPNRHSADPATRHSADPYAPDTGGFGDRWSGQPRPGRHAGADYPDPYGQDHSGPAYEEPTQRQYRDEPPRRLPRPDDPTNTSGRRYRRDRPDSDYDE